MSEVPQETDSLSKEKKELLSIWIVIFFSELTALFTAFLMTILLLSILGQKIGLFNPYGFHVLHNPVLGTACCVLYLWAIAGFASIIYTAISGYKKGLKGLNK